MCMGNTTGSISSRINNTYCTGESEINNKLYHKELSIICMSRRQAEIQTTSEMTSYFAMTKCYYILTRSTTATQTLFHPVSKPFL